MKIQKTMLTNNKTNFRGNVKNNEYLKEGIQYASNKDLINFSNNLQKISEIEDGITYTIKSSGEHVYYDGAKSKSLYLEAKSKSGKRIIKYLSETFTYPHGKTVGSLTEDLIIKLNDVLEDLYKTKSQHDVSRIKTLKKISKYLV